MGTIPSYDAATEPLADADEFYLEQGSGADRSKRATIAMVSAKVVSDVTPTIAAEVTRAQTAEVRLAERDYKLALYHYILSDAADVNPIGQINGPAANISETVYPPTELALIDNSNIAPLYGWFERYAYHNPSVSVDPIIMTSGDVGMRTLADSLPVGAASAYGTDRKFMLYWSQSLERIVVATDAAHNGTAMSRIGLLLPEGSPIPSPPQADPDELIVRFQRAVLANTLDSFTVSVHRAAGLGNFSVVLPLSDITLFDTGTTVAVRARRAAGGYDWRIDCWEEP